MKKLIMSIAILSFGFTSCKEDDDPCKMCTTTTSIDGEVQDLMTVTAEYCDDVLEGINGQTINTGDMTTTTSCD